MKTLWTTVQRSRARFILVCLAVGFIPASSGSAVAAPYTWSGVSGAIWDLSNTNWAGAPSNPWDGTNGPTNTATFNLTGSNSAVVSAVTTNGLTFAPTTTGTFTLTGGTIALAGGTSAQILNLLSGGTTGSTAASTLTIASTITSTTNFFIGGFGTTILSGSNSLSGTVTIGSGTSRVTNPFVQVNNNDALAGAAAVVVIGGGTNTAVGQSLRLGNGITIAGKTLTLSTSSVNGTNRASLQVAAGSTATWNGNITGVGNGSMSLYGDGLMTIGAGTDTIVTNVGIRGSGTGVMNSAITSLSKTDPGTWIINSASNTFTSSAIVSSGFVSIASIANAGVASPIGSGTTISVGNTSSGAVSNWGFLRITSSTGGSSNRPITISGGTVGGSGGVDSAVPAGQLLTMSGSVTASGSTANFVLTGSGNGLYSGNISGTGATIVGFYKTGSGTWTLSGSNSYTGTTFINGGVLALGSANALGTTGTVRFGGGGLQYGPNNTGDLSAKILGSGSAISIDTNGQNVTYASSLAATNTAGLTKTGAGTLTLSASNAFGGTTTVNGGTLALGNAFALTSTTPTVAVNAGTLDVGGNSLTLTSLSGTSGEGVITTGVAGAVTLTATNSGNTAYAGGIVDGSGSISLVKIGAGTLTLSGSSSYSGGTQINGGVVSVSNVGALSTTGPISFGGGTLQYGSGNQVDYSARILGSGSPVQVDTNGQSVTFASAIDASNVGGFTKSGAGLLTITGSTIPGTMTLNGGTTDIAAAGAGFTGATMKVGTVSGLATAVISSGEVSLTPSAFGGIVIADSTTGTAALNVTGGSTTINLTNSSARVMVGNKGVGSLDISGGLVTIAGGNQVYVGGDSQYSAANAKGTLTISSGTLAITGSGAFVLAASSTSSQTGITGTLNLDGGELQTIRPITTSTSALTSTVNFNGGLLKSLVSSTTFMQGLTAAYVRNGGALIDTNGYDVTIGQALLTGTGGSTGGLAKSGVGTLTLTGASTFTGATTVASGTLALSGGTNRLPTATTLGFTGGTAALNGISQTVAGLTVSDSTSAALRGIGTSASTLTVTSAVTLGGGSGTSTLLVMPQMSGSTASNVTLAAASGITVNAGGDLRLGIVGYNASGSGNSNAQANGTLNAATPVTLNAGGSFTLDRMVVMTGSTSSSSGIQQHVGALTMTGGRLFIDNAIAADRRLTINGNMMVTGGTMSITSINDMAIQLNATSTNTLNPASFDRNMGIALYGGSSTLSAGVPLGRVFTRLSTVGTVTLTSSVSGGNIGTLNINDGSASPGGTTVRLGSNLTLVAGNGGLDGLPQFTTYSFVPEADGRADLGIDADGFTLDLSGNSNRWQPNSTVSGTVATQAYWQLSSTSGSGRFVANGFNFAYTASSTAGTLNAYTNVGPNVILESKAGSNVANNLGSGTISASSIFRYSGTAATATPSTLTAGTSIGDLEVAGTGALKVLSIAGTVGNVRVSNGSLVLGGTAAIPTMPSLEVTSGTFDVAGYATTITDLTGSAGGTITSSSNTTTTLTVGGANSTRFDGTLANSSGTLNVTKTGLGTLTLGGGSTFTGMTTIVAGTIALGHGNGLGGGGPLAVNGGGLDLQGFSPTVGALSGSAGGLITSGSAGVATLTVSSASDSTFAGLIENGLGTVGLTKAGSGALTLTAAHTYTGPTNVNAGTLVVNGSLAGDVATLSSAVLGGSGSVGVISGAGLVGPGNSPGILTAPSIDPTGGLDFAFEFTQAAPDYASSTASDNDVLWLTGGTPFTSSLTSANTVSIYLTQSAASLDTLTGGFFTATSGDFFTSISGATFQYFVQDANGTFSYNGQTYTTLSQYDASKSVSIATVSQNGGQVMQLVVVPEPGAILLAGLGIAASAWARRRRRD